MTDHHGDHRSPATRQSPALPTRAAELLDIVPCALLEGEVDAGEHRAITYFSGTASEMYGYTPTEVLGRDPKLLSAEPYDRLDQWRATFEVTGHWHQSARHVTKDGRPIDVEIDGVARREENG